MKSLTRNAKRIVHALLLQQFLLSGTEIAFAETVRDFAIDDKGAAVRCVLCTDGDSIDRLSHYCDASSSAGDPIKVFVKSTDQSDWEFLPQATPAFGSKSRRESLPAPLYELCADGFGLGKQSSIDSQETEKWDSSADNGADSYDPASQDEGPELSAISGSSKISSSASPDDSNSGGRTSVLSDEEAGPASPPGGTKRTKLEGMLTGLGLPAKTIPSKIEGAAFVPGGRMTIGFDNGGTPGLIRFMASPVHPSGIRANKDGFPSFANYFLGTLGGKISPYAKEFYGYYGKEWAVDGKHLTAGLNPLFGNLPTRVARIEDCSPRQNDSASDSPVFSPTGKYECFRLILVAGLVAQNPHARSIFHARATVVMEAFYKNGGRLLEPDRPRVVFAKLTSPLERLFDVTGKTVYGFEPSVTADSRLLVVQVLKGNGGPGHAFLFNSNPGSSAGWTRPVPLAHLHNFKHMRFCMQPDLSLAACDAQHQTTLGAAYPLAAEPLKTSEGRPLSQNAFHIFGYPWLDQDGRNLLFQANRRSNLSIVGADTNYNIFQVDGSANLVTNYQRANSSAIPCPAQDYELCKGLTFSLVPGSASGFWAVYPEAPKLLFPFTQLRPLLFVFNRTPSFIGKGEAAYSEVSTNDSVDQDYLVALQMNEPIVEDRHYEYNKIFSTFNISTDRVADVSGNGNTARLVGGAAFPREHTGVDTPESNQVGFKGKAVYFPPGASARIPSSGPLSQPRRGLTVEVAVKILGSLSNTTPIAVKDRSWALFLGQDGIPRVSLWIDGDEFTSDAIGSPLPLNQWSHLLFTYRAQGPTRFRFFVNGEEFLIGEDTRVSFAKKSAGHRARRSPKTPDVPEGPQGLPEGMVDGSSKDIILGPLSSNRAGGSRAVYLLDEFKLSRVVRNKWYAKEAAFAPTELVHMNAAIADSFPAKLPLGLFKQDLTIPKPVADLINRGKFQDAVKIGESLFHDPALSTNKAGKSQGMSCATCHIPSKAFSDPGRFVMRNKGDKIGHTVPPIINRAFSTSQLRDMSASNLVTQALLPLMSELEMNADPDQVAKLLLDPRGKYFERLNEIFNLTAVKNLSLEEQTTRVLRVLAVSLAAFETTIFSGNSLVDKIQTGAVTSPPADVLRGMQLFNSKARCSACHSGPNFSDERAHVTGTAITTKASLGAITGRKRDDGAFKTPTLRGLKNGPFFHNGMARSLTEVIAFYNIGGRKVDNLDPEMRRLHLTPQEINDLVAFLRALQGDVVSGMP